jgi:hypothetical protein
MPTIGERQLFSLSPNLFRSLRHGYLAKAIEPLRAARKVEQRRCTRPQVNSPSANENHFVGCIRVNHKLRSVSLCAQESQVAFAM